MAQLTGDMGAISATQQRTGYTAGAGLEWMADPNWILGVEYDYFNFGNESYAGFGPTAAGFDRFFSESVKLNYQEVLGRVSYKFATADSTVATPSAVPAASWNGLYAGAIAGYTWSIDNSVYTSSSTYFQLPGLNGNIGGAVAATGTGSAPVGTSAFAGGGQAGYNQLYNDYLFGVETDIQGVVGGKSKGTALNAGFVPQTFFLIPTAGIITSSRSLDYLGTVRGRFGFFQTPGLLAFVTGGFAYGGVKANTAITETFGYIDTPTPFGTAGGSSTIALGWSGGGGLEWMFAPSWSAKVEYLYYDIRGTYGLPPIQQFGNFGATLESVNASQSSTRFAASDVRLGISYHFGN